MWPRCSWLFIFFLICVLDSIKGFSRCRGYWSFFLSICCVYISSAGCVELCFVVSALSMLGVSYAIQNEKKL